MSRFNFIYAEEELGHRAKTVYIYLRDRSDASGVCWRESRPLPVSWSSRLEPSSGRWGIWSAQDWWRSTSDTEKTAVSPATFIA